MTLQSLGSQIIFPFYAGLGLIIFGMILFSIRKTVLEWITLRISYRIYTVIKNWAEIQDVGFEEVGPDKSTAFSLIVRNNK